MADDNDKRFFEYLNNVQNMVSGIFKTLHGITELENSHSTLFNLLEYYDENKFVSKFDLHYINDDDLDSSSIEITNYNSSLFSITEVLIMNIITEKVEWSKLPPQLNDEVNNFIIEGSFSFIKNQNIILNNDNINLAILMIAKWLIHIGNWAIKYSGYIINPAEGGNLSIFEFIELILEESKNSDEKIFQRLRNIQKSLEYLDRILGNNGVSTVLWTVCILEFNLIFYKINDRFFLCRYNLVQQEGLD